MQKGPLTPKGFRDIMPEAAKKRRAIINTVSAELEGYGFVPLETPTIEFAETLLGKYGEEEKLIYQFEDRGGRKLALRYDLTVPLARFIANNLGLLNPTFSRYQIGQSFRGENTQKGRYREFTQFDFDTAGLASPEEDARVIAAAIESVRKLGFSEAKILLNDRVNFEGMPIEVVRAVDKIGKIGKEGAKKELAEKGMSQDKIDLMDKIETSQPTENLKAVASILEDKYQLKQDRDFVFDPTLARGLDYYTGIIMELKPNGKPDELSVGGGGRYDNLIEMFAGKNIPAVGFSFGVDRLVDLL